MPAPLPAVLSQVDPAQAWLPWEPDSRQPFDAKWAAHLFRRAAFGATPDEVQEAVKAGPQAAIDRLLRGEPSAEARGKMLADTGLHFAKQGEIEQLRGWWVYAMLNSGHPLREKLTLFWHNHFATSVAKVRRADLMFRQNELIRRHALGKFGPFLKEMGRDPAMLLWLDSNRNVKGAPNENYAREVMELFSLGVGNYTEKDIREAARALTGWHTDGGQNEFEFNPAVHDEGMKTVLGKAGNWNGDDVARICLEQPAAARFLVGKLYRFLVSENPPPKGLIEPLAEQYRKSDYDTAALVRTMLASRMFFSDHALFQRVKWPVEFVLGAVRETLPGPVAPASLVPSIDAMGQPLFAPPNVKGWVAGKAWLNNATLLARNNFAEVVAMGTLTTPPRPNNNARFVASKPVLVKDQAAPIDAPEPPPALDSATFVRNAKATKPDQIVARLEEMLLPGGMPAHAKSKLEAYLAEGNPQGPALDRRVREAVHAVLCMPEYQLA